MSPPAFLLRNLLLAVCLQAGALPLHAQDPPVRVRVSQFHMGMMVHITLWAPTVEEGRHAAAVAFERVVQINQIMSDYEPKSELSRLCRRAGTGPVEVSPELLEVLSAARRFAELTGGVYDPTIGPVSRLWRTARHDGHPPDPSALEAAHALVDYRSLLLDPEKRTAELTRPGMLLDLGSIAKGYAADEALRILREQGFSIAAIEAGGDKVFGDAPPGTAGWLVESPQPGVEPFRLSRCAVSISGDTVQHLTLEGSKRLSHVIDAHTARGVSSGQMCVVVAPRGMLSDPLATIGTLLAPAALEALIEKHFPKVQVSVFQGTPDEQPQKPRVPPL